MLTASILTLATLASLAVASPLPGGGGEPDISVGSKLAEKQHSKKVSLKEVCYLELFADVENHKVLFEKEIKIQDDYGKDVYVNDGYKKDENNVLFYFKEFCYKDFNFAEHNEETVKKSGASISADELKKLINNKDVTSGDFDTNFGKAKEKDRLEKGHEKGYGYKLARRDFDDFDRDGLQFDRFPKDEYGFDDAQRLSFSPDRDVGLDGGFGAGSFRDKKDKGDHRYKHKETTKEYGYDSRKGKDGKKDGRKDW
ncbi:hypothetical protein JCM10213_003013 [Rhodosporidiobolus nylandii]